LAEAENALEEAAAALEINSDLTRALLAPESGEEEADPSPPVAVEAEAPRFKSYNTSVRMAVVAKWLLPPEASINFRPGRLVVNCTIGQGGDLLRFVVYESTGNAILDHAGLEALRAAAPCPPFPPELAAFSQVDITLTFTAQSHQRTKANSPGLNTETGS
jgi:TonB family protein